MAREKRNWYQMIQWEMERHGETFSDVVHSTFLGDGLSELYREFDAGYGSEEGEPFTLWTHNRVYFPVGYDGAESVASVPRNPCDVKTEHVGG